ncbi:hypothetical protein BDV98DRAFT_602741 [Pterulicium gracile]|uniref:Uncharacterized protein n=1 Tax=Pterulicium gracile TaxID=1884261 RepID=A0A5C3QMS7_9AGAR|nr:hypothetical protein BDV98DRAFT_602741 [Pterula gracilis]
MLPLQNTLIAFFALLFFSIPLVSSSPAPRPSSTRKPSTTARPSSTRANTGLTATVYIEDGYTGVVPYANPPAASTVTIKVEAGWGEWDVNGDGKPDSVLHNRFRRAVPTHVPI